MAYWKGMSPSVKYAMEWFFLAAGHLPMRPLSQAACAFDQVCGVLAMRMYSATLRVSVWKGRTVRGPSPTWSLYWAQTVRCAWSGLPGTGMGKRSPKPRTPASPPK
ncbi:hypothetical protein FQZ97_580110 [compost metagenome]